MSNYIRMHTGLYSGPCSAHGLKQARGLLAVYLLPTGPSPLLSTGAAVSISVVVTAIVFTVIGIFIGLLVMRICSSKKAVYSPPAERQANIGSTAPFGPVYEELSPKEQIELNTNQAYGPVGM